MSELVEIAVRADRHRGNVVFVHGLMDLEEGNRKAARAGFAQFLAITAKLATDHPEVPDFQRDLSVALQRQAAMDLQEGKGTGHRIAPTRSFRSLSSACAIAPASRGSSINGRDGSTHPT